MCMYDREEIERQQKESHYRKMHEKGQTEEAQRDLARLALVRKQREEAAQKRQLEKKGIVRPINDFKNQLYFLQHKKQQQPLHPPKRNDLF